MAKGWFSKHVVGLSDAAKAAILDSSYYLDTNSDVRDEGADPLEHFLAYGFSEGRNPAPWINLENVKEILKETVGKDDLSVWQLVDFVSNANSETVRWVSHSICPAWIMRQLGHEDGAFLSLLNTRIPDNGLSPHPALLRVKPSEDFQTVLDLIRNSHKLDFGALSVVDLAEYCRQHRDLNHLKNNPASAFAHLWTHGYRENRLKYMGGRAPRNVTEDFLFLLNLTIVIRQGLANGSIYFGNRFNSLPNTELHFLDANQNGIPALQDFEVTNPSTWLDLNMLLDARGRIESGSVFAQPQRLDQLRCESIQDSDLISGKYELTTSRVIYSINLGGYDELPEPPDLDEATCF